MNPFPMLFSQSRFNGQAHGNTYERTFLIRPFMVTKCYQTAADGLQNDSWKIVGSAPNLERETAQKALFVQEIRPLGTSYSPSKWAARPLLRLF